MPTSGTNVALPTVGMADQPPALAPQSLGEALRLLRNRVHLRRDELAQAASVSAGAVSNYENDVSVPSAFALRRITNVLADALGVQPAVLWEQVGLILDATTD